MNSMNSNLQHLSKAPDIEGSHEMYRANLNAQESKTIFYEFGVSDGNGQNSYATALDMLETFYSLPPEALVIPSKGSNGQWGALITLASGALLEELKRSVKE